MQFDVSVWLGVQTRSPQDEMKRTIELQKVCENPGFKGDHQQVIEWFNTHEAHGLYPFGNGIWEQQPQWLLDDFKMLRLLREYEDLKKKYLSQPLGAPTLR